MDINKRVVRRSLGNNVVEAVAAAYPLLGSTCYEVIKDSNVYAYIDYDRLCGDAGEAAVLYRQLISQVRERLPDLGPPLCFADCRPARKNNYAVAGQGAYKASFHLRFPHGPVFHCGLCVRDRVRCVEGIDFKVYKKRESQQLLRLPYYQKEVQDDRKRFSVDRHSRLRQVIGDDPAQTMPEPGQHELYYVCTDREADVTHAALNEEQHEFNSFDDIISFVGGKTFDDLDSVNRFVETHVARFVFQVSRGGSWITVGRTKTEVGEAPTLRFFYLESKGKRTSTPLPQWCFRTRTRLVFDPSPNAEPNTVNMWTGFPFSADAALPPPTELLEHLRAFLGGEMCTWFLQWLGAVFTRPWEKTRVAFVLYSAQQQTGKSWLCEFLCDWIFKRYAVADTGIDWITNKFNSSLAYRLLVCCDELSSVGGDDWHGRFDRVKGLVTNRSIMIEPKGKEKMQVSDCSNYIFCTNHCNAIKIEEEDARYCVCEVSDRFAKDRTYYAQLSDECCNDEYARRFFSYVYLHADLDYDLVARRPITEIYTLMRLQTSSSATRFFHYWTKEASGAQFTAKWGATADGMKSATAVQFAEEFGAAALASWTISGSELWSAYREWCANWKETEIKRQTFSTAAGKAFPVREKRGGEYQYYFPKHLAQPDA